MTNIESHLKDDITIAELLSLISSQPHDVEGRTGYILVTDAAMAKASLKSTETINYCCLHGFIEIKSLSSRCHEFRITHKGAAFNDCSGSNHRYK